MSSDFLTLRGRSYAISGWMRWMDRMMQPLMYVLSGCNKSDIQHTHMRHVVGVSLDIDRSLIIPTVSSDPTWVLWMWLPFFHMPIVWWWTHYVVLEGDSARSRFVWWLEKDGKVYINKIPLYGKVKMLVWPVWTTMQFFGLDKQWNQIPIRLWAYGKIGDGQYHDAILL